MGRVIWMALNPYFVFFHALLLIIALVIPSIPPRVSSMVILTLSLSYITAMLYLIIRRSLVIVVKFTEDGLVVHGAGASPYLGMWLLPATWSALRGRVGV